MNSIAERYVKLVLALGQHDPDYVDAYYGPPAWKIEAEKRKAPLTAIDTEAGRLSADLGRMPGTGSDELTVLRYNYLGRQLEALRARVRML